jgi:hypothetical protein
MRFRDIPSFTRSANYSVDVQWRHLDSQLAGFAEDARVSPAACAIYLDEAKLVVLTLFPNFLELDPLCRSE